MPTSDFESGRTIPLQIPAPLWREWKINGVHADHSAELQAEYGDATPEIVAVLTRCGRRY